MFSLKLSNISSKKFNGNHSITQDSMILTPSFSLLPKTPQRPFFPIKRVQQPSKAVIIRPVPNLRPYEYTPVSSLVEKVRSNDSLNRTQAPNNRQDRLNVTDAFQYRCEGLLDDVLTSTNLISKVRRKSDVSSLSGGASTFERKIGSLMHESLLNRNMKPVTLFKSNSTSPSKFRSSVKKMMTMRGVVQGWKKLGSSKDLNNGKPKGLNRSNTLDPNGSVMKQISMRRDESQGLILGGNHDSAEVLKVSKPSEIDKENSRDLISKTKLSDKNGNELKLQKVLKDIKMANEDNISNQEYKLSKQNSQSKSLKKMSKSVEKNSMTGKKRKALKAFKIEDNQIINLKKKAADSGNEDQDKLNISNNSLDEKLEDLNVTERVNQKQGSSIIDNYSSTGELHEFGKRELPIIKEEKGVKSQTDKLEKSKKSESKKWTHLNGVKSLVQLVGVAEKRSTSPMFKNYFHLGNKKVVEVKSSSKITKSLKIDDTEKNLDFTRETKATRDQGKRSNVLTANRRLFTPKISSNKQIVTAYSSSNIMSP